VGKRTTANAKTPAEPRHAANGGGARYRGLCGSAVAIALAWAATVQAQTAVLPAQAAPAPQIGVPATPIGAPSEQFAALQAPVVPLETFSPQTPLPQVWRLPPVDPQVVAHLLRVDDAAPARLPAVDNQVPSRLPPVGPPGSLLTERAPESVAMLPPSADGPIFFANPRDPGVPYESLAEEAAKEGAPVVPPGFKNGMWQFTTFRKTFLMPGARNTGFGMEDFLLQTTIALPFFTREKPIFITPYFQAHVLQGPVPVDLPPQLYDVSLEFRIMRQLNPKWGMDLALAPAILSDFQNMTHQAYRLTGRGVFLYTWTGTVQIAGGVTVTGRQDVPILPVGGVIWTPGPNWRTEAVFPRPRILRRFIDTDRAAWWVYTAGEFGGNSYAIERASGADDLATYRDLRFELGLERKTPAGAYNRFEVGYVFDRDISYLSGTPSFAPSPTVMLRGEATF